MQAYCQLARQGLGLMIFLLSGGEREEGEAGEIESHAKMCCAVWCCVVLCTSLDTYYIIFLHCSPSTPHHHHNIISPLPSLHIL